MQQNNSTSAPTNGLTKNMHLFWRFPMTQRRDEKHDLIAAPRLGPRHGCQSASMPLRKVAVRVGSWRSLGLVGVALRGDELNGWGELLGVVVVLAQENNFIVELAGAWRCSAAAGAGAEGGGVL